MTKRTLLVLSATALLSLPVLAADKPDFSGNWAMNKDKSDFGQMPPQMAPEKITRKITHKEDDLKATTTQTGSRGEMTSELEYAIGKSGKVKTQMGESEVSPKWDGSVLVVSSKRETPNGTFEIEERWEMAADKKSYLLTTKIAGTPIGDIVTKVLMEKQ
ncbi:MAG: hypothetical protein K2Q23_14255 [Bryobacteraceae bacterium]|nr:hypothetical protein [Bryobacteraceae bacterium]